MESRKEVITSIKAVWEDYPLEVLHNEDITWYVVNNNYNCPHVFKKNNKYFLPRVLKAYNEGSCNSTGVCLDCIDDLLKIERKKKRDEIEKIWNDS